MWAGDECYLSYLPAAHIMEFTAQLVFFCYGSQIGYACPKTISSKVSLETCETAYHDAARGGAAPS